MLLRLADGRGRREGGDGEEGEGVVTQPVKPSTFSTPTLLLPPAHAAMTLYSFSWPAISLPPPPSLPPSPSCRQGGDP